MAGLWLRHNHHVQMPPIVRLRWDRKGVILHRGDQAFRPVGLWLREYFFHPTGSRNPDKDVERRRVRAWHRAETGVYAVRMSLWEVHRARMVIFPTRRCMGLVVCNQLYEIEMANLVFGVV